MRVEGNCHIPMPVVRLFHHLLQVTNISMDLISTEFTESGFNELPFCRRLYNAYLHSTRHGELRKLSR